MYVDPVTLVVEKVEAAYESLRKKTTDVYIQRARQLYTVAQQRTSLFLLALDDVSIVALADPSLHGRDNIVTLMREIDHSRSAPFIHLSASAFWFYFLFHIFLLRYSLSGGLSTSSCINIYTVRKKTHTRCLEKMDLICNQL